MKSRHKARQAALQILYRYDLSWQNQGTLPPVDQALAADLTKHFDHFQVPTELREFAAELVAGTLTERSELDNKIEAKTPNWKLSRMSVIDRNLLRMALYEMFHFKDVPVKVTMDEAIELAKQFGTQESPGFVNAILDALQPQKTA